MRKLFLAVLVVFSVQPAAAVTVDRIAAVIDEQVITVSEVSQMVELRFFPRTARLDDDFRRAVLEALIAQALRFRDVERFRPEDISKDSIEARLLEIQKRFSAPADFEAALIRTELTADELRALIKRQLQVEAYIQERFAPLVFIPNEEIEAYYAGTWTKQRRDRGLAVMPLSDVREEVRSLLRASRLTEEVEQWTTKLRQRSNVDIYAWR